MNVNYHELTMDESKDSPARKKQFLTICVGGIGIFLNAFANAGGFHSVSMTEGYFPGGEFVYRMDKRDYAAFLGNTDCLTNKLRLPESHDYADYLYTIFIDNPSETSAQNTRFFVGALNPTDDSKQILLQQAATAGSSSSAPSEDFCKRGHYETAPSSLPRVKAGVSHFPFTNGFVSALVQSLKVIPAMIRYGKQHGEGTHHPITITTCSVRQRMCTHYVPLEQQEVFLMGRPSDPYDSSAMKSSTTTTTSPTMEEETPEESSSNEEL